MSHQDRMRDKSNAFTAAVNSFRQAVEQLDDATSVRTPQQGGWSVAQIAWHVGTTNELLAGIISGEVPMAAPAPPGFSENPGVFGGIPERMETFPQLVPPAVVTRTEGLAKLRGSEPRVLATFQALTPERASGYCVTFPFGTLSMSQMTDFVTAHVMRHLGQVQRAVASV